LIRLINLGDEQVKIFELDDFWQMRAHLDKLEETYFHPQSSDKVISLTSDKLEQLYRILDTSALDRALARKDRKLRKLGLRTGKIER